MSRFSGKKGRNRSTVSGKARSRELVSRICRGGM